MKNTRISVLFLLAFVLATTTVSAQTSTVKDMMQLSISKIKASSDAGRVTEKTFSDVFFRNDTSKLNCIFYHRFSSSNTYRITAFGLSDKIETINVYVCHKDNGNWNIVAKNTMTGSDINFKFIPQVGGSYGLIVKGTLKSDVNNALFNVIIDRD